MSFFVVVLFGGSIVFPKILFALICWFWQHLFGFEHVSFQKISSSSITSCHFFLILNFLLLFELSLYLLRPIRFMIIFEIIVLYLLTIHNVLKQKIKKPAVCVLFFKSYSLFLSISYVMSSRGQKIYKLGAPSMQISIAQILTPTRPWHHQDLSNIRYFSNMNFILRFNFFTAYADFLYVKSEIFVFALLYILKCKFIFLRICWTVFVCLTDYVQTACQLGKANITFSSILEIYFRFCRVVFSLKLNNSKPCGRCSLLRLNFFDFFVVNDK